MGQPTIVPMVNTPLNMVGVVSRLASAYVNLYAKFPSVNLLTVCSGIIGIENRGGAAIQNGNFGNLTAPAGYTGRAWEANGLWFLDFPSVEAGAAYFWEFMRERFPSVLVDAEQGNVDAAVRDLFRHGYVGATTTEEQEKAYLKGVVLYAKQASSSAVTIVNHFRRDYVGIAIGVGSLLGAGLLGYLGQKGHV